MSELSLEVAAEDLVVEALGHPDRLLLIRSLGVDHRLESCAVARGSVRPSGGIREADRLTDFVEVESYALVSCREGLDKLEQEESSAPCPVVGGSAGRTST